MFFSRMKQAPAKGEQELSKAEYDRIISNCFNVHGLPKSVYKQIAMSVLKSVDELISGQTKMNKTLRNFVEKEFKAQADKGENKEQKDYDPHFRRFEKSLNLLESSLKTKASLKVLKEKADVTSLQRLEERYQLLANEMTGNTFRAGLVFKVNKIKS